VFNLQELYTGQNRILLGSVYNRSSTCPESESPSGGGLPTLGQTQIPEYSDSDCTPLILMD